MLELSNPHNIAPSQAICSLLVFLLEPEQHPARSLYKATGLSTVLTYMLPFSYLFFFILLPLFSVIKTDIVCPDGKLCGTREPSG